jgi:hypothetical protein
MKTACGRDINRRLHRSDLTAPQGAKIDRSATETRLEAGEEAKVRTDPGMQSMNSCFVISPAFAVCCLDFKVALNDMQNLCALA